VNTKQKIVAVAAVVLAGGSIAGGLATASALEKPAPPAPTEADAPEPGDTPDQPGAVDTPEPGDTPDAPGQ
jgi:hypothetical protein